MPFSEDAGPSQNRQSGPVLSPPPDRLGVWLDRASGRLPPFIDAYKAFAALALWLPLMLGGFQLLGRGSPVAGVVLALVLMAPVAFVRRYHPEYRHR